MRREREREREREIWLRGRGRGRERLEMVEGNGKRRRENFLAFTAFSHFLSQQEKIIKQEITEKTRVFEEEEEGEVEKTRVENRVDHQF